MWNGTGPLSYPSRRSEIGPLCSEIRLTSSVLLCFTAHPANGEGADKQLIASSAALKESKWTLVELGTE